MKLKFEIEPNNAVLKALFRVIQNDEFSKVNIVEPDIFSIDFKFFDEQPNENTVEGMQTEGLKKDNTENNKVSTDSLPKIDKIFQNKVKIEKSWNDFYENIIKRIQQFEFLNKSYIQNKDILINFKNQNTKEHVRKINLSLLPLDLLFINRFDNFDIFNTRYNHNDSFDVLKSNFQNNQFENKIFSDQKLFKNFENSNSKFLFDNILNNILSKMEISDFTNESSYNSSKTFVNNLEKTISNTNDIKFNDYNFNSKFVKNNSDKFVNSVSYFSDIFNENKNKKLFQFIQTSFLKTKIDNTKSDFSNFISNINKNDKTDKKENLFKTDFIKISENTYRNSLFTSNNSNDNFSDFSNKNISNFLEDDKHYSKAFSDKNTFDNTKLTINYSPVITLANANSESRFELMKELEKHKRELVEIIESVYRRREAGAYV